jgi:CRISPR/Cas system-associated protein Cas10 (large subunit of type III CRISPR-Cas system)
MIFVYFDGDDIGPALELLLLDDLIEEAREYSRSINIAFRAVLNTLTDGEDVDVIVAGGDDLIVSWPDGSLATTDVHRIRHIFHDSCGRTMSAGVGFSLSEAAANLRRAKLAGKDRIVAPAVNFS